MPLILIFLNNRQEEERRRREEELLRQREMEEQMRRQREENYRAGNFMDVRAALPWEYNRLVQVLVIRFDHHFCFHRGIWTSGCTAVALWACQVRFCILFLF